MPRLDSDPVSWRVLQTRSRQEKAIGRTLAAAGIEFFLPLTPRIRFHGGRRRIVQEPLFPSYLFLRGTQEDVYFATATRRVARVVAAPDQATLRRELAQIEIALAAGGQLDVYPYLTVGRRVRVVRGPFRGVEGIVDDRPKPDRIVLCIQALGRAACLEIDADLLEPLD